MISFTRSVILSVVIAATGCQSTQTYPGAKTDADMVVTPSGLRYIDMAVGTGDEAQAGMLVTVHYTGYLMDGKKFDSSVDRNEPLPFVIGSGRVIKGWEEGITSMKVGGHRKLIIPSQLAYGTRGYPGLIPPDATLVFDIELLSVKKGGQ